MQRKTQIPAKLFRLGKVIQNSESPFAFCVKWISGKFFSLPLIPLTDNPSLGASDLRYSLSDNLSSGTSME
ncbi:MAG: hypothetical protein FWH55_11080 [Oscillospiraceae bacterium]|nr:hypothetical protein [Oscillospiraceae bacterium]